MAIGTGMALAIGAVAGLGGSMMSSNAAGDAADTVADANQSATAASMQMYKQNRADQAPWLEAGQSALNTLLGGNFGMSPPTRTEISNMLLSEAGKGYLNIEPWQDTGGTGGVIRNTIMAVRDKTEDNARADISQEVDTAYELAMEEYNRAGIENKGLLTEGPGEFTESPG